MVNLRAIANSVTQSINPNVLCERWRSIGAVTADTGKREPVWSKAPLIVQVQAHTDKELRQLDLLNIGGVSRKVFCNAQVASLVRVAQKGGDLLVFPAGVLPEGTTWLCTVVHERWPAWTTFAITLQNDNYEAFKC